MGAIVENIISAQELKRRGISAVDGALRKGPVHVIRRNRPSYVILSEEGYQRLIGYRQASERLWERLLSEGPAGDRKAEAIDRQIDADRGSWENA